MSLNVPMPKSVKPSVPMPQSVKPTVPMPQSVKPTVPMPQSLKPRPSVMNPMFLAPNLNTPPPKISVPNYPPPKIISPPIPSSASLATPSTSSPLVINPMYRSTPAKAIKVITLDENDNLPTSNDDISAITVDDTDDITVTNVIPGVPTSHISKISGRKTMFCMPGVDQAPRVALDNMWWCEGCGHVNYTPGTICTVCGRRSMAGVLCENSFLKRRLVETQAEMESTQRDLKRARTTIMDREEQLLLTETLPVHPPKIVNLDESVESITCVPDPATDALTMEFEEASKTDTKDSTGNQSPTYVAPKPEDTTEPDQELNTLDQDQAEMEF